MTLRFRTGIVISLLLFLQFGVTQVAGAQVHISVSKAFGEKVIVAVPLFDVEAGTIVSPDAVRDVLMFDLSNSGHFSLVANTEFVDETETDDRISGRIKFQEWAALGAEVLVKGRIEGTLSEMSIEATVYDLAQGKPIFGRRYSGRHSDWRAAVHHISDDIVKQLTGEDGIAQTKIAFVSNVTGAKEIYVMDYDGENRRRVTRDNAISISPDWFPGGEDLIYTMIGDSRQETRRARIAEGTSSRVTSFPGLNAFPAPSPSGGEIVMTLSRDGNPEIYRLRANGSEPRRLTFGRNTESSPCWSPDGRRMAYVSDRSGAPQMYTMSATGGSSQRLTYEGRYNTSPDWSPKGNLVAFTAKIDGVFQICTVDVGSKEVVRLTAGPGDKEDPSWARDGRHIAYSVTSGGKSDLYMLDIYELEPVRLTSGAGDYLSPTWSD